MPTPWYTRSTEQARVERRALARALGRGRPAVWRRRWRARLALIATHLTESQVYWLGRCPAPGLIHLQPKSWRVCGKVRWCPYCYVRRVVGEVFRRVRAVEYKIRSHELELWSWSSQWCYRAEGLDHIVQEPGWLTMGNRTLLKGYCSNWTLAPHGSDRLLLRHDSVALVSADSRWPNHSKRRPPSGIWSVERYGGEWDERSLSDFVLSAFPYPSGWMTAEPDWTGCVLAALQGFGRQFRAAGLLRGTRAQGRDGRAVPGYRPVFR